MTCVAGWTTREWQFVFRQLQWVFLFSKPPDRAHLLGQGGSFSWHTAAAPAATITTTATAVAAATTTTTTEGGTEPLMLVLYIPFQCYKLFTNLAPYQFSLSPVITEQRMWRKQTIIARRSMAKPSKTTEQAYQRPVHDLYCRRRDKIYPGIFKLCYIYGLFNDNASNSRLHRTCHSNYSAVLWRQQLTV